MHEYSIVCSLLESVERVARERRATNVERIRVQLGEQSGVEVDLLRSAFELAREGTICRAAELEIHRLPAVWECSLCEEPIEAGGRLRCPECGMPARLAGGDEIVLERLELEVA